MYIVYHGDRTVRFAGPADGSAWSGAVIELGAGETVGLAKVLQKLENNKELLVKTGDPQAVFDAFLREFEVVDAAGGMVTSPCGDTLMILRNGRWDLPKGHLEPDETLEICSVREVCEECGISEVERNGLITRTFHFYLLDGKWTMKRTAWFAMKSEACDCVPQTCEGIEHAEWVRDAELGRHLESSFPLVREVFRRAGKI